MQDRPTLTRDEDGTLTVTIPDPLATSLGVDDGDTVEWRVHSDHAITLHPVED